MPQKYPLFKFAGLQGSAANLQDQLDAVKADLESLQDQARAAIPQGWLQLPQAGALTAEQRDELAQQSTDEEPLTPFLPPPELDLDYRPEGNGQELVLQVRENQAKMCQNLRCTDALVTSYAATSGMYAV